MPSAPTTSLDLTAADVVADPYPHFAAERQRHAVAWHEPQRHLADLLARRRERGAAQTAGSAGSGATGSRRRTWSRSTCCTATR